MTFSEKHFLCDVATGLVFLKLSVSLGLTLGCWMN